MKTNGAWHVLSLAEDREPFALPQLSSLVPVVECDFSVTFVSFGTLSEN